MLTVDTRGLQDLRRVLKAAPVEIRKGIQAESKQWAPTLVRAAQAGARGEVEKRIAQSAQTQIMAKGLVVRFGATGRIGRSPLREVTRPYEFGTARPDLFASYDSHHRLSKRPMDVKRRTQKQVPRINSKGRFLYPAIAQCTSDLVSRYVRVIAESVTHA